MVSRHSRAKVMVVPDDFNPDDILVTVAHPHGDIEVPLAEWIRRGPGPRPLVRLASARRRSTGESVPLEAVDDPWRRGTA
jgi:hypothetical protein